MGTTLGDACDPECGDCYECVSGTCTAKQQGAECAPLKCSDYLFGWDDSEDQCRRLAPNDLPGTCDGAGTCALPSVEECPVERGGATFTCDFPCVGETSACALYALAADVKVADVCNTGMICFVQCSTSPQGRWADFTLSECGTTGKCESDSVECTPYACELEFGGCLDSCEQEDQCLSAYSGTNGACG
jgi:hypothetical protein